MFKAIREFIDGLMQASVPFLYYQIIWRCSFCGATSIVNYLDEEHSTYHRPAKPRDCKCCGTESRPMAVRIGDDVKSVYLRNACLEIVSVRARTPEPPTAARQE